MKDILVISLGAVAVLVAIGLIVLSAFVPTAGDDGSWISSWSAFCLFGAIAICFLTDRFIDEWSKRQ